MAIKSTYILFELSGDTFSVDVKNIIHIMEMTDITPLPNTPVFMKGITIFRGNILPVIDLRVKFKLQAEIQDLSKGLVVVTKFISNEKEQEIGLIVDEVHEVAEFSEIDVGAYPEIGTKYNIEFIKGFVKLQDDVIIVLNIDKILSSVEVEILKKSTEKLNLNKKT